MCWRPGWNVGVTDSPPSSVSLAVVVQAHPARAHLHQSLIAALGECEVVMDPEPDGRRAPIRTYLACLRAFPADAAALLVVQDDARPCENFRARAEQAVRERPNSLVALFLAGAPQRSARLAQQAHRRGESWVRMEARDWTPTVALVWPRQYAERFLDWATAYRGKNPKPIGDDNVVGAWTTAENVPVWATVPSLVEHPDVEPSLIGRKAGAGRNRFRVAAVPPAA